jgi:hypothetical protein
MDPGLAQLVLWGKLNLAKGMRDVLDLGLTRTVTLQEAERNWWCRGLPSHTCLSTSELLPLVQSAEAVGIGAAGESSPDFRWGWTPSLRGRSTLSCGGSLLVVPDDTSESILGKVSVMRHVFGQLE